MALDIASARNTTMRALTGSFTAANLALKASVCPERKTGSGARSRTRKPFSSADQRRGFEVSPSRASGARTPPRFSQSENRESHPPAKPYSDQHQ